jgi:hypothetical protein
MADIFNGRYTADIQGDFVVFLIGMRVNKLLAFRKWMPVASAMGPMLSTLYRHPEKGFLSGQTFLAWRTILLVQYWRSFEDLERFARHPIEPHLSAWRRFNQTIGGDGSVGFFHETYQVKAGQYECIYNNMPRFGLGVAADHVPAVGRRETARRRLGGENEPAVPTPIEYRHAPHRRFLATGAGERADAAPL